MSFLDHFKKRGLSRDCFLALDIGTEFVKALVVRENKDKSKGRVIGASQIRQNYRNMSYGAVSDIKGVIQTCEEAISEANFMAGTKKVEQVIVGIAGEFVKGMTTVVHYERANPARRMDIPELKNIIQKVQWKASSQMKKRLAWENGYKEIDIKLIGANIVNVKIDGYSVANPIGFQGKNVSIGIFNAYCPSIHQDALNTIVETLGLELMSIAVEPYAVINSLGLEDKQEFGSIFIDVGGGTTDVALMRKGVLEGTLMFSVGGRCFTNRLANDLKLPFEKAEELKIKYSSGLIKDSLSEKLDKILFEDSEVWRTGLLVALENFLGEKNEPLPSRILLCGGGSALPGIKEVLGSSQFAESLPFAKKPDISFIQPKEAVYITDETKTLKDPQSITPLGLASLIVKRKSEQDELTEILNKAVKINQN